MNNARENLLVLPSQRIHAYLEWQLRRARVGLVPLFPSVLGELHAAPIGTLFEQEPVRKKD